MAGHGNTRHSNRPSRGGRHKRPPKGGFQTGPRGNPEESRASPSSQTQQSPNAIPEIQTPAIQPSPLTEAVSSDNPRFADLARENKIDPALLQTVVEDMQFDHTTLVQAATIPDLLSGNDILAQAKTGTGKTVAFLLPAIQRLISKNKTPGQDVSVLVISPTRELALQIAQEGRRLLQRLPKYTVRVAIGGTDENREEKQIINACDILIATPGRLLHHLTNNGEDSLLLSKVQSLEVLVLDEADRLLDMGFLPDIQKIIRLLPDKAVTNRQGMMFSATVGEHVEKAAHLALSKNYKFVSTIPEGGIKTHERVPQHLIVVPSFSDMAAGLVGALRRESERIGPDKFKAIVFAPTAAQVDFYVEIVRHFTDLPPPLALHARMTQNKRTKAMEEFRLAAGGILIATDVIARGIDVKDVTNVFQAGIPPDKESYIHRLGRTARAGAEGSGTFIITASEMYFPQYVLKEIPFVEQPADLSARELVASAASQLDPDMQQKAYQAWLGFYKSALKPLRWDVDRLVREANGYALDGLGAPEVPLLYKSTVSKMGLKGVKGLKVGPDPAAATRGGRPRAARD
ncbi:ATP-dependent RNA helicase MSS116 precursor [Thozetella sp. PMI_491]|nr:ATP-dependent RNA helicase MSS116 precursor [Thozetella sp. PMI_491]